MHEVIERLGLDWFVILIGRPAFEDAPLPYPTTFSEVRDKLGELQGEEKLNDAIEYCARLLKREEDRSDKVESKAFTLIGITGIATGFIIGFAGLLLDQEKITSVAMLTIAAVLYILVVVSLMWTIFLAVKVVTVGDYQFTYPSANDIFRLSDTSLQDVKHERAVSLFYSFVHNHQMVNRKATYLGGAQLWFRNSIILLLVLTLLLAVHTLFRSPAPTTGTSVSTPTSVFVDMVPSPESTYLPAHTVTGVPTRRPTATLSATILPTPTMTTIATP